MTNADPSTLAAEEAQDLFCPHCDYNLRTLAGPRCPECGREVDLEALRVSGIPWVHRATLGRWRAYWQTVYWVLRHGRRIRAEAARPLDGQHGQRFRWTVLATLAVALAAVAGFNLWMDLRDGSADLTGWDWLLWAAGLGAVWGALAFDSGLATWFCVPRGLSRPRQDRALELIPYAIAPLALAPGLVAVLLLMIGLDEALTDSVPWIETPSMIVGLASIAMLGVVLIYWYAKTLGTIVSLTHRPLGGDLLMAGLLTLAWLVITPVFLATLAGVVFYALLMGYSLR